MKKLLLSKILPAALLCSYVAQADFIRQEDLATGVIEDIQINGPGETGEESGEEESTMTIGADGMLLTLYGRDSLDGSITELDSYLVSDRPEGVLALATGDPHIPLATGEDRRTRADELIYLTANFSDFSTTPEAPRAAKVLYLQRLGIEYPGDSNRVVDVNDGDFRVISDVTVDEAGDLTLSDDRDDENVHTGEFYTGSRTYLTGEVLYGERGKEKFRILTIISKEGEPELLTEIATATVRVWPVFSNGTITAGGSPIDGKRFISAPPSIELKGEDLYPDSNTFVVISRDPITDEDGVLQTGTVILDKLIASHDDEEPEDLNYILSSEEWADKATQDDTYLIEVFTEAPFERTRGQRARLMHTPLEIQSNISVRGSFVAAE